MRMTIDVTANSVTFNVELKGKHYAKVCKRTDFGCRAERPFTGMFRMAYPHIDGACDTIIARYLMDLMKE